MSLLQGLIGFGIGATQAIAETKKQDMAAARELNLATVRAKREAAAKAGNIEAEHQNRLALANKQSELRIQEEIDKEKREQEAERDQTIEIAGLIRRAQAGDTLAQNELLARDKSWRVEPTETNIVNLKGPDGTIIAINTKTPAGAERVIELLASGYVEAGKASLESPTLSGELVRIHGSGTQPIITLSDDPRIPGMLAEYPNLRVDPVMPQTRKDSLGRPIISRGGVDFVVLSDGTERPLSEIEGRTGATSTRTQPITPDSAGTQPTTAETLNIEQLPPGDYIRLATGPIQGLQRFGLNLPGLGDLLGMFSENSQEAIGAAQTRAARTFDMAKKNMASAYRYNSDRTSNLDIQTAERLFPKFGLITTDIGTYNQALAVRDAIRLDIEANRQIAREDLPASRMATEKARNNARDFLTNITLVLPTIDSFINAYELTELTIPVGIGNRKRQLIDLPYAVLADKEKVPASVFANLSDREKELVKLWFTYNGWQL